MNNELNNNIYTPETSFSASEFEWVGQDVSKSEEITRPSTSFWQDAWGRIKRDKIALTLVIILAIVILCSIFVPMLMPYKFDEQHMQHINARLFFRGDGCFHLLGTDGLGRDTLVRVWSGGRISMLIAFATVSINVVVGCIYGGFAGYMGGTVDNIMMRIVEILVGIPYMLIVILLMVIMEPGIYTIILAMASTGWTGMARMVRGEVLRLKEQEFVIAAKAMGGSASRILIKHLFPNVLSIIIVNLTLSIPSAIFSEAFLSYIGLGVKPPIASWGSLCNEAAGLYKLYPEQLFVPAICISLTMLSFNLLGDKLRDAFDPKLRR